MEMRDRRKSARLQREQEALLLTKKRWHPPHPLAWLFIIGAVGLLLCLSAWQVTRLWWKQDLIATIQKYQLSPALKTLPEDEKKLRSMGFQRVVLRGEFLHDDEAHLAARYYHSQLGYHILTPFLLEDKRIILLNRGWVAAAEKENTKRQHGAGSEGKLTLITMIRTDKDRNYFTPQHDVLKNIWFWRDVKEIEKARGYPLVPVAADVLYSVPESGIPIASDGLVELRNDHLGYAITWLLIALSGIVILFFYHYHAPTGQKD
jgi:surfeit locus 1 family protein